jgi:hypothetical protein
MKHIKNFGLFESVSIEEATFGRARNIRKSIKDGDFELFKEMIDVLLQNRDYKLPETSKDTVAWFDKVDDLLRGSLSFSLEYNRYEMAEYLLDNHEFSKSDIYKSYKFASTSKKCDAEKCLEFLRDKTGFEI